MKTFVLIEIVEVFLSQFYFLMTLKSFKVVKGFIAMKNLNFKENLSIHFYLSFPTSFPLCNLNYDIFPAKLQTFQGFLVFIFHFNSHLCLFLISQLFHSRNDKFHSKFFFFFVHWIYVSIFISPLTNLKQISIYEFVKKGLLLESHRNASGLCSCMEQSWLCFQRTRWNLARDSSLWKGRRTRPKLPGRLHQLRECFKGSENLWSVSSNKTFLRTFY